MATVAKSSSDSAVLSDGGGAQSNNLSASDRFRLSELWVVAKTNNGVLIENDDRPFTVALGPTATWVLIADKAG